MGLLNRILVCHARRLFFRIASVSPRQLLQQSSSSSTTDSNNKNVVTTTLEENYCETTNNIIWAETVLTYLSAAIDLIGWINFTLDCTFTIKLFHLGNNNNDGHNDDDDSHVYAVILLMGLILGRIVEFRGSYLLLLGNNHHHFIINNNGNSDSSKTTTGGGDFADGGGIRWSPFWIAPPYVRTSKKYHRVFPILYSIVFTETAVFLLQDYPSLSIYAHWMVIHVPPVPLQTFDQVNVAFSAMMLCILLSLFIITILSSLLRLSWHSWNVREKSGNACKIVIFVTLWILLVRFIFDVLDRAVEVVFRDAESRLPSNTIMGIEICNPAVVHVPDGSYEFCDEESFAVHVAFAWLAAFTFSLYLFFRPLRLQDLNDYNDEYCMDNCNISGLYSNGGTTKRSITKPEASTAAGHGAVTVTTLTTGQWYYARSNDSADENCSEKDPEVGNTPPVSSNKSPSNNHNQDTTSGATAETGSNTCPGVIQDQQQAASSATTITAAVEYHEHDSNTNDGAMCTEMDDPEHAYCVEMMGIMQSPAEMAATIVAVATAGLSPQQQQQQQQSPRQESGDDSLPLVVKSSLTTA